MDRTSHKGPEEIDGIKDEEPKGVVVLWEESDHVLDSIGAKAGARLHAAPMMNQRERRRYLPCSPSTTLQSSYFRLLANWSSRLASHFGRPLLT